MRETPLLTLASISQLSPFQTAPLNVCQNRKPAIQESMHDLDTFASPEAAKAERRMEDAGIRCDSGMDILSQNCVNRSKPAP
jgi:hypothetical protein